jgi:mutS2 protein
MNEKSMRILEFPKILNMLEDMAGSLLGKDLCKKLLPGTDISYIQKEQKETSAALDRIRTKGPLSLVGLKDIKDSIKRLEIGSSLSISELLNISDSLRVCKRAMDYGIHEDADNILLDILEDYFRTLDNIPLLAKELDKCILSEDAISDEASPELSRIRKQLKNIASRIHNELNNIMNSYRDYLMEPVVTMRNSAYCLPVKAEFKNKVNGIIHDQSSSGSTFFIEPIAVIHMNNEIKELEIAEAKEIEKILEQLSSMAMPYIATLNLNQDTLARLDFIFAKAKLSGKMNATEPIFNTKHFINIKDARHPLLDKDKVVPINISLGKDYDLLIITGPNTGGKTVSLKTVGLFTLMGQAGLHIPAFNGSELSVFNDAFSDIGDEQSIEQSLSFFSGHMTNIVDILEKADSNSLCLFDELGAGTDPTEGAALAIAILSFLHRMKTVTMATTHYSELKIFALNTAGVENASCEFDINTLRPTYKILIGVAGKSNAFAISKKLGLPDFIIDEAKNHISNDEQSFEDLLAKLEENRLIIEKERAEIEQQKAEINKLKNRYVDKDNKLDKRSDDIINKAKTKANEILEEAKKTADESIKNINKIAANAGLGKALEEQREKLRANIKKNQISSDIKPKIDKPQKIIAKDLQIGDNIHIYSLNMDGTVSSLPNDKGMLFVQMGILRTQVHISDISLIETKKEEIKQVHKSRSSSFMKAANISPEVNVIAMNVDEACSVLDKYLDDALLSHLNSVKIIHGRGTGALQKGIHTYLKKLNFIKSYKLADFEEGGTAVTIVHFK